MRKVLSHLLFLFLLSDVSYAKCIAQNDGSISVIKSISDEDLFLMAEASKIIEFYDDTYVLTLESIEAINKIAKLLENNPDYNLVISGHYFKSFSKRRNLKLSLLQAEAIKTYFTFVKLEENRIKVNGFGDRIPLSLTNLSVNTRIDLTINY